MFEAASSQPGGPPLHPGGIVLDALFAPDGQQVVTASSTVANRNEVLSLRAEGGGHVQFWDWRTGRRLLGPVALPREPRGLAYSPDGKRLAVVCADGWLALLRARDGKLLHKIDTGNHSYKVLKKTRRSTEDVFIEMARVTREWIDSKLK